MGVDSVNTTKNISILIQIITGIISIQGIFLTLPKEHQILTDLLKLESFVQFIELMFYIFILRYVAIDNMAMVRYFDWFITTPLMLFTTMVYFRYRNAVQEKQTLTIGQFLNQYKRDVIIIFTLNLLMLLFGYLAETDKLNLVIANSIGTIFFILAFGVLYTYTVKDTEPNQQNSQTIQENRQLFYFMLVVWGTYGVAAFTDDVTKNNMFNILDVLAKNFFGLYLYYQAVNVAK
jgi:bacteriorhodopsin